MWDPAFNDPSAQQQQQQRSPDLTARPTAAATATADRDRRTLHTIRAKQPEINPVERVDPTTDLRLARYDNNDDTPSYQNGYPLPSNQVPIGGPTSDRVMLTSEDIMPPPPPPPLPPPSSSKEAFMIGSTALPLEASSIDTVALNLHQHQQRHVHSHIDNTNNIPMEIDTFSSLSSTLSPDQTDDNTHLPVPAESIPSSPLPPQISTQEERYTQDQRPISSSPAATLSPALAPALAPAPPRSSSTSPTRNTRDTSPCIARLYIPSSHMSLFQDALKSPPDPDLKVRKKTVRFNKSNSPSRSEHKHERREAESSVSYSSSSKSPSTPSSSQAASSKSTFGNTKSTNTQPQIVEKDPEERMAELMELKQMKIRQEDLLHLKEQVFQTGQNLEEKQTILDEVRAERKVLHAELNRYIAMVKQVQKDLELATQAETQLTKERDQLSQYLTQLRDHDFNVLKEEVDQLRSKKGLRPLPSLEQEQEEFMGRYLEERRGQWREDGVVQDSSSSSSHLPSSSLVAAAATTDRHGAGSSSSSSTAAAVVATSSRSSRTPSSSSTTGPSTSRGRDRDNTESSRSNRAHQSSSSSAYSRSHSTISTSSKSKPESSSRHNSNRSSSRRQSSRSRSSSPPAHSSSSSRDERSKKRSRY